jgi:ssDNA-binding Zn-finger/Zn-ribbon topoisomerase 1
MDTAINSKTNEIVNAWSIDTDPSYLLYKEDIWYADPNNIETFNPEKVKDIKKVEVKYRIGTEKVINKFGTEYSISPCFFIPNKEELEINTIPESAEHKSLKNWIYNKVKERKLIFSYSKVFKPFEYDNEININELDIDFNKIGIEIIVKNNKKQRADIILPFKNKHEVFGCGIVIEVQLNKQYDHIEMRRSYEWAFKGYSICWVHKTDYEDQEGIIVLKERLKLEPIALLLNNFKEETEKDLRFITQNLSRKIDEKMIELNYPFCIGECKKCHNGYITIKKGKFGFFYGCSNYPDCRQIIQIPKEYEKLRTK